MAARDPDFEEWVREHFAALGSLEIKRMFGGAGVYSHGLIFALLDDGLVWLKADETTVPALEAAGSRQFTYPGKDGAVMTLGYWSLPETAVDDPDEAVEWARGAIDVALRKAAAKAPRKAKA
ncbi:TfoX/Sxy family protein [soil metagenome]